MLVIGEKERTADTVAVRQHRKGDLGPMPRAEVLLKLKKEIAGKGLTT
jgi:threonyl-tRNA synthetase